MNEKTYPEIVGDLVARWVEGAPSHDRGDLVIGTSVRQWASALKRDLDAAVDDRRANPVGMVVLVAIRQDLAKSGIVDPPNPGVAVDVPPIRGATCSVDVPPISG